MYAYKAVRSAFTLHPSDRTVPYDTTAITISLHYGAVSSSGQVTEFAVAGNMLNSVL